MIVGLQWSVVLLADPLPRPCPRPSFSGMSRPTLFWFVSGFYKACAIGYVQCLVTYCFIKVRGWLTGRDAVADEHERTREQRLAHQEFVRLQRAAQPTPRVNHSHVDL